MTTKTRTASPRSQWIHDHYRLEQNADGRWRAVNSGTGVNPQTGQQYSWHDEHIGDTREEVCRFARSHWGHFNFRDEAEAFATIFSY